MRRGLGGAASRRSKAARRQAAPGLIFVGTTLASMACLCCCARSRPQGCPRRSGCRLRAAAGRTNVPRMLAASRPGYSWRYSRCPPSALHTTMMVRGTEDPRGPVLRAVPAGAAGRKIACGSDARLARWRRWHTKATYSSRVERQLDVHKPVNVVRHRRHAAPRREGRPGNDVDRATTAPALLVVRVRLL